MTRTLNRAALTLACTAGLAACATTSPVLEAPPASAYNPLAIPDRAFSSEAEVIDVYLARASTDDAEITRETGRDSSGLGSRMILVTTDGYRDDSVRGEQWRIVLGESDGGFRILSAGIRYNCVRGANPGWSRDLCP